MLCFFAYSTCHKFPPNAHVHENENRHLKDIGVDVEDKQVWASDGLRMGIQQKWVGIILWVCSCQECWRIPANDRGVQSRILTMKVLDKKKMASV